MTYTARDLDNPQSLNRYSYVLNNPLKYIDPSGHYVGFENEEEIIDFDDEGVYASPGSPMDEMIEEYMELVGAYVGLMTSKDEDVAKAAQELYDDPDKVVTIGFGDVGGGADALISPTNLGEAIVQAIRGQGASIDWTITLDRSLRETDSLIGTLAHEVYHASDPRLSDSVQEELMAYQFAYAATGKTGKYSGLDPQNYGHLVEARGYLEDTGVRAYEALQLYPLYPMSSGWDDALMFVSQGYWVIIPGGVPNVEGCP